MSFKWIKEEVSYVTPCFTFSLYLWQCQSIWLWCYNSYVKYIMTNDLLLLWLFSWLFSKKFVFLVVWEFIFSHLKSSNFFHPRQAILFNVQGVTLKKKIPDIKNAFSMLFGIFSNCKLWKCTYVQIHHENVNTINVLFMFNYFFFLKIQ